MKLVHHYILLFFISCFTINAQNDSAYKAPRVIFDAGIGMGLNKGASFVSYNEFEKVTAKLKNTETFNLSILFPNSPFKRNFFYFSMGVSYSNITINHHFYDYETADSVSYNYYTFAENETVKNYNVLSLGCGFSHYWFKNNWIVYQKLAVNFNQPYDNTSKVSYSEYHLNTHKAYSDIYITEDNPNGAYLTTYETTRSYEDKYNLANSLNPYLQLGVSYKYKMIAPFVNCEVHNFKFGTIAKANIGLQIIIK